MTRMALRYRTMALVANCGSAGSDSGSGGGGGGSDASDGPQPTEARQG